MNTNPDQVVAIEIVLPDSGRVELSDTFRPRGRALNGVGDSVDAPLFWSSLDTAVIEVVDSATGVTISNSVGTGRLQARAGNLRSNPQAVTVLAHLDSMAAGGPTADTVFLTPPDTVKPDSLSSALQIQAFATGGTASNRRVVYALTTFPVSDAVVTLVPKDTVLTNLSGAASAQVKYHSGAVPDSVVVMASMIRLDSSSVGGSPVRFVVEFRP